LHNFIWEIRAKIVPVAESLFRYVTPAKAGVYSQKTGFPLSREWQNVVSATGTK